MESSFVLFSFLEATRRRCDILHHVEVAVAPSGESSEAFIREGRWGWFPPQGMGFGSIPVLGGGPAIWGWGVDAGWEMGPRQIHDTVGKIFRAATTRLILLHTADREGRIDNLQWRFAFTPKKLVWYVFSQALPKKIKLVESSAFKYKCTDESDSALFANQSLEFYLN